MAIVIYLPAYSLRRLFSCLLLGLVLAPDAAWAQQIALSLDTIEHPAFTARGIQVGLDVFHAGHANISIAELRVGVKADGVVLRDLKLHCDNFQFDSERLNCGNGILRRGDRPALAFSVDYRFADSKLNLILKDADVAGWSTVVKRLRRLSPVGKFDLALTADKDRAKFDLAIRGLGFNTADYSVAGEKIVAVVSVDATRAGSTWAWQAEADWSGGEAFWSPWYRKAGVHLKAEGSMTPAQIVVGQARVTLDNLGSATAGLSWDRARAAVTRWGFVTDPLDMKAAMKEWLQPVLDARALPVVTATGTMRYAAEWSDGALQSFYAGIENAAVNEATGRLSLAGVNASIPWERDGETAAELSIAGGKLDDFALGGFRVPVRLRGADVSIAAVDIPFLDGRMTIDDFHAAGRDTAWTSHFSGGIEGVSMFRLTSAMGLPPMAGNMSLHVPDASYSDHVLDLGGDLGIDVFDGRIVARNLKVVDPLSKTSRVLADVEARRLDLGLLTSTFSFGSILGRLDIDIQGLELQDWKPLAFNARLASSPGEYRRAISRGALIDISSIGGVAGAAAVKAIPAAGFFNTFSYDRIGWSCLLKDGVCHMDGVAPENGGYVLVDGSGIPTVKVMGYNRNIDWNLLVSRLKAVIAGNTKAVIE